MVEWWWHGQRNEPPPRLVEGNVDVDVERVGELERLTAALLVERRAEVFRGQGPPPGLRVPRLGEAMLPT
jgi:hypothetical protein